MQGFSGLMAMNRTPDGVPHRMNMVAVDVMSGLYLFAALSASEIEQLLAVGAVRTVAKAG
jgi:crotonobetainyl-CoA:carnitine CoA-transferase CaiB-like acyl-CoA transferase